MSLPFVPPCCFPLSHFWVPHLGRATHFLSLFLFGSHPHSSFFFRATFRVIKCVKEGRIRVCSTPSEKPEDLVKSWPFGSINLTDHSDPTVAWLCKVYLLDSGFLRSMLIGGGSFPEFQDRRWVYVFLLWNFPKSPKESLLTPWTSCWEYTAGWDSV